MYSRFLLTACAHRFFGEKAKKRILTIHICLNFHYITFVYARHCDKSCVQFSIRAGRSPGNISNVNDLTVQKCEYHKWDLFNTIS